MIIVGEKMVKTIVTGLGISFLVLIPGISRGDTFVRWPWEEVQMEITLEPFSHTLSGRCLITLPSRGINRVGFLLGDNLKVTQVKWAGQPLLPEQAASFEPEEVSEAYGVYGRWSQENALFYYAAIPKKIPPGGSPVLDIFWAGTIYEPQVERAFSREEIALEAKGSIDTMGVFLSPSAWWYPRLPDAPVHHTVTINLPLGWRAVTDGEVVKEESRSEGVQVTYRTLLPTNALTLSAGPYTVTSDTLGSIALLAYFFPPQADLAPRYLAAVKRYIALYQDLVGPYPFTRFSVVDNFLPSGYGMPGWTLLGSEVIRLPFIVETSLGHEVLHNWFGNSLWVDYREGNWCEGLTTYFADYLYQAQKDSASAADYRLNVLKEYAAYVNPDNDYPVAEFSERANRTDRAIGYGKVMMIFHMLRNLMDQRDTTLFPRLIKEVYQKYKGKAIGWSVWQKEAQRLYQERLDWFFQQWVTAKGAIKIEIKDAKCDQTEETWRARIQLAVIPNTPRPYWLLLPIRAITEGGVLDYQAFITQSPQALEIAGPGSLKALRIDPDFQLFRHLYPSEAPVTMAFFFGDERAVWVVPESGVHKEAYLKCAQGLKREGQEIVTPSQYHYAEGKEPEREVRSLWILGSPDENPLWSHFPPPEELFRYLPYRAPRWREESALEAGFTLKGEEFRGGRLTITFITWHPHALGEKVIVYTLALPEADPIAGTRKLPHYGRYSYLLFDGETNIKKGVWEAVGDHPMLWKVPGS